MTAYHESFPSRKSTHLKRFDYSENQRYFITICSDQRKKLFSKVTVGEGLAPPEVHLSSIGKIIENQILLLHQRYPSATIENFVVMPNHIHMLLLLENPTGGASPSPTTHDIVCALKSLVTRACRQNGYHASIWQRSYYEHIIRNEDDYKNCWHYIDNNPAHWAEDKYFQ